MEASLPSISSKLLEVVDPLSPPSPRFPTLSSTSWLRNDSVRSKHRLKLNDRTLVLVVTPDVLMLVLDIVPIVPILAELTDGVPLRLDNIDIAEPGRGVGLGLGGSSESVSSEPDQAAGWLRLFTRIGFGGTAIRGRSDEATLPPVSLPGVLSTRFGPGMGGTVVNRSSLRMGAPFCVALPDRMSKRGLRPLSSTFLRALMPMQSTSCFIASRSVTLRRSPVRRTVPVRRSVPGGGKPLCRTGVVNLSCALGRGVAWAENRGVIYAGFGVRYVETIRMVRGVSMYERVCPSPRSALFGGSGNASVAGPQLNPINDAVASSSIGRGGSGEDLERKIDSTGEDDTSED